MILDRMALAWLDWRRNRVATSREEYREALGQLKISAEIEDGRMKVIAQHPLILDLADDASHLLDESGGENYVQFELIGTCLRPVLVTVQWADGLSPGEKNERLQVEVKRLREALRGLYAVAGLRKWQTRWPVVMKMVREALEEDGEG